MKDESSSVNNKRVLVLGTASICSRLLDEGFKLTCVDEVHHHMFNVGSFPDLSVPNDKPLINDIRNFGLSERDKRKAQWKMNKRR